MCRDITWSEAGYLQFLGSRIPDEERLGLRDDSSEVYLLPNVRWGFFDPLSDQRFPRRDHFDWCSVLDNSLIGIELRDTAISTHGLMYVASIFLICDCKEPYNVRVSGRAIRLVIERLLENGDAAVEWDQFKGFLRHLIDEGRHLERTGLPEDHREYRFFHLFGWLYMMAVDENAESAEFVQWNETLREWCKSGLHVTDDDVCLTGWQNMVDTRIGNEVMREEFSNCLRRLQAQ